MPDGNREAKSMENTTHRSHRSHTAHKGHRRESRSKINVELLFKDVQVPSVPGGNHEAKSMVGVVVLAGPFSQGMLDPKHLGEIAGPRTQGVLDPDKR